MSELRAAEYARTEAELAGWPVGITTWFRGDVWICHVDNVSPGATIARSRGASRNEAVENALARARTRLARTRRFPV